jgi:hypothetical protein
MEPGGSLSCSQDLATGLYPETCYFPKVHFNILPSTARSSEWSLPFRLSSQNIVRISYLLHARYALHPLTRLCLVTLQYLVKSTNYTLGFVQFSTPCFDLHLDPNVLLSSRLPNTLRLCSSLTREKGFTPSKMGVVTVLYGLIFML